jgi:hypothetical protein
MVAPARPDPLVEAADLDVSPVTSGSGTKAKSMWNGASRFRRWK